MATRDVFSEDQLARLRGFPEISQVELFRYYTLTTADEEFVLGFRRPSNVFGVAVQLCTLPWLGYVPDELTAAPAAAVARLSERLRLPVGTLREYGDREQTRTDHLVRVARYLGWRRAGELEWRELAEYLLARAMEHDSPTALFRLACEQLASSRVIRPGVVNVLERVATARTAARAGTWNLLEHLVTPTREAELDGVLLVDPMLGRTPLAWLGQGATNPSPAGVKTELEKLTYLRRLDAHTLDLSMLPDQRRRWLARIADRSTAQQMGRRDPVVRYPILLAWLSQTAVDVLDEVLLMFDQAISARESHALEKTKARLAERAKTGEVRQRLLDEILDVVLDVGIDDERVGGKLRGDIGMERMRSARDTSPPKLPRDHGHLAELNASIGYLRQFTPAVLAAVRFAGGTDAAELLRAVSILAELYATGGRKVPEPAPEGFVPTKWAGYLADARTAGDITAYRHYWELAVLLGLRDGLRCGDIHVPGSRRYADPASFLLTRAQWEPLRTEYCHLVDRPAGFDDALAVADDLLHTYLTDLDRLLAAGGGPGEVRLGDDGELIIPRLDADIVPDEADALREELSAMIPRLPIASLLAEVDAHTGFLDHFTHAGGKVVRSPELKRNLIFVLLAEAMNMGLTAMAESCGVSYDVLAWTAEWYLRPETLEPVNAAVVNYHHRLPMTQHFGDGTLSSSDGQRFPLRGKSLTGRHLSRYFGRGQGFTTYTHVSDQHSTYATKVIMAYAPEAHYTLDGILGNITDLPISEHSTDTAGATLANFALFDLTGLQLSARIRDMGKLTLCRTGAKSDFETRYPHVGRLLSRRFNTELVRTHWDDLLRVAASVKYGHATAAMVVGKLCSSKRQQNALTAAIKEWGLLRRTLFVTKVLVDKTFRRRIVRQLNKGENIHTLRRDIFHAHEGAVRRRHHEQQTEQAWCLTIVANAVVTWMSEYFGLAVARKRARGEHVDDELLAHIWPTHHENVNFMGSIRLDIASELAELDATGYRPLREVPAAADADGSNVADPADGGVGQ